MYVCMYVCMYISGWIFQKVLPEMVQKGLISNRRNLGLFAPKSIRFPSKDRKSKDLFLIPDTFLRAIFPFSQNALESLYCSVILTAGFRLVFVSLLRNTPVSALVSGLN